MPVVFAYCVLLPLSITASSAATRSRVEPTSLKKETYDYADRWRRSKSRSLVIHTDMHGVFSSQSRGINIGIGYEVKINANVCATPAGKSQEKTQTKNPIFYSNNAHMAMEHGTLDDSLLLPPSSSSASSFFPNEDLQHCVLSLIFPLLPSITSPLTVE